MKYISEKEKMYLIRVVCYQLIKLYGEEAEVFIFCENLYQKIIFISRGLEYEKYFVNISIYRIVLKDLFLFTLKEEYPEVPKDSLTLIGIRVMRDYSIDYIARILNISKEYYLQLEIGNYKFSNELTYDKIAQLLNAYEKDFYADHSLQAKAEKVK